MGQLLLFYEKMIDVGRKSSCFPFHSTITFIVDTTQMISTLSYVRHYQTFQRKYYVCFITELNQFLIIFYVLQ